MPADLAVLGPGILSLPAAQAATATGIRTAGFTPDPLAAAELNAGRPPGSGVLSVAELRRMLAAGFTATSDPAALSRVRVALICATRTEAVRAAARVLAPRLRPGALVVLESAGLPGMTRNVLAPLLREGSGLVAGRDFHLACAVARPMPPPGQGAPGPGGPPAPRGARVLGGLTPACTEAAAAFYGRLADRVVRARGVAEAEVAAAVEANLRHVTAALVNETAVLCHELGIDLWDVLRCAEAGGNPAPQVLRPGPAPAWPTGPVDVGGRLRLAGLAREINERMPGYVARRAATLLNEHGKSARGARVLLLGVVCQPDLPGEAGAPAREIAARLLGLGAELSFHDPFVARWQVSGRPVARAAALYDAAASADLTLLLAHHSVYDLQGLAAKAQLLLDTRGATPAGAAHRL